MNATDRRTYVMQYARGTYRVGQETPGGNPRRNPDDHAKVLGRDPLREYGPPGNDYYEAYSSTKRTDGVQTEIMELTEQTELTEPM